MQLFKKKSIFASDYFDFLLAGWKKMIFRKLVAFMRYLRVFLINFFYWIVFTIIKLTRRILTCIHFLEVEVKFSWLCEETSELLSQILIQALIYFADKEQNAYMTRTFDSKAISFDLLCFTARMNRLKHMLAINLMR